MPSARLKDVWEIMRAKRTRLYAQGIGKLRSDWPGTFSSYTHSMTQTLLDHGVGACEITVYGWKTLHTVHKKIWDLKNEWMR